MANTLNSTNNIEVMNSIIDRTISEFEDDGIKRVGKNAFRGSDIESVTLPNVRSLGEKAFKDCESLSDITIGENYEGVVSTSNDTFDGCEGVNVIVPKDKVDLYKNSDSWSGFVEKGMVVNWGKCGGNDDVVVTYREGEPLWIPRKFLSCAFSGTSINPPLTTGSIGYMGTASCGGTSILVYRLPQGIGEWLYNETESTAHNVRPYGQSSGNPSGGLYKGLALYSDTLKSGETWNVDVMGWGIGIRKREDIDVYIPGQAGNGFSDSSTLVPDSARCLFSSIKDGEYYLVAQQTFDSTANYSVNSSRTLLYGQLTAFNVDDNDSGSDHIYLRKFANMTSLPNGTTNMGKKLPSPSELCTPIGSGTQGSIYGMKDSFTVNWGKCGGTEDVKVTYRKGEGLWVPKAFLAQAFNSDWTAKTASDGSNYLGEEVGYRGGSLSSGTGLAVYNLPQNISKWLYDNAESLPNKGYYGESANDYSRAYRGIAIYPDHIGTDTSSDWSSSIHWGIGIRTKDDIDVQGFTSSGGHSLLLTSPLKEGDFYNNMKEGSYYLVAQIATGSSSKSSETILQGQLQKFNIDDTGTDHIWLRHFESMTSKPSASNQGSKYTLDNSMFKKATLPLTVNWGKCGGEEDVIINYDKEEGLWIPTKFLTQGYDTSNYRPKADALFLSDGVTKDTSVGYKTWFGRDDHGSKTDRASAPSSYYYMSIYKLPQALGKYLYENAESELSTVRSYVGDSHTGNSSYLYKAVALYPDVIDGASSSWAIDGYCRPGRWGVAIRKKEDITIEGLNTSTYETIDTYSTVKNYSQYQALEDDAYYLVAQYGCPSGDSYQQGTMSKALDVFGNNKIYFRHWNTLTSTPTPTLSTHGAKYDVPLSLPPDNAKPLGGKIFYIDPSDNGATYTFYDSSWKKVRANTVSELSSAEYYTVSGTPSKDKFYVLYNSIASDSNRSYTYKDNGSIVYDSLFDDSVDCYGIGKGKSNTLTIMNLGGGYTSTSTTIWYYCKSKNDSVTNGCSDWYIPSDDELGALYNSDINKQWFTSRMIPSSSEHIGEQNKAYRIWDNGVSTFVNKIGGGYCVLIRSF